jgi:hypothetical protein
MSNHTITVKYEGLAFDVNFDYYSAIKGIREPGTGLPLEPDEPASCEIYTIAMINPNDTDIYVDVTACLSKSMFAWFDDQVSDYIGSHS